MIIISSLLYFRSYKYLTVIGLTVIFFDKIKTYLFQIFLFVKMYDKIIYIAYFLIIKYNKSNFFKTPIRLYLF